MGPHDTKLSTLITNIVYLVGLYSKIRIPMWNNNKLLRESDNYFAKSIKRRLLHERSTTSSSLLPLCPFLSPSYPSFIYSPVSAKILCNLYILLLYQRHRKIYRNGGGDTSIKNGFRLQPFASFFATLECSFYT